mgnify:CR=1 FL=1
MPLVIDTVGNTLEQTIEDALVAFIQYLPDLTAALIILAIGYFLGQRLESVAARLAARLGVDSKLDGTRVGNTVQDDTRERTDDKVDSNQQPHGGQPAQQPVALRYGPVATAVGLAVKYYVILFGAFIAARRLDIGGLSVWLEKLVAYAPNFFGGVAVIIVGLVFADYAANRVRSSDFSEESDYGTWISALVRGVVYAVVLIVGLEMIGFDLRLVYIVTEGIASSIGVGLTFAIAVAIGIAGGLFVKDYYEQHLRGNVTEG